MTIQPNGNGTPPATGLSASAPLTVAGAFLLAVQAIMGAFWGVVDDLQLWPQLTLSTQALVSAAVTSVAILVTLIWAARRTTPTAAPILPENTVVGVTNGTQRVVATATIPSAADAVANQGDSAQPASQ